MRERPVLMAIVAATFLVSVAACGSDDGANVRSADSCAPGSGSAGGGSGAADSGSGSASAGSGSAAGSGAATCEPKCEPFGDESSARTTVRVTLDEWTITADADRAPAGVIHFALQNAGKEPHEFVVVEADSPDDLPRDAQGALDEAALPKGSVIGEVEPFPSGERCDGTFDLAAGTYQLVCNSVEEHDGKTEAHLKQGMVTTFTVT